MNGSIRYALLETSQQAKMGFALAEECAARGAQVVLVAGPVTLKANHPAIRRINVESAREMLATALQAFPEMDAAILSAAVADYRPESAAEQKIRRTKGRISPLHSSPIPTSPQRSEK